MSRYRDGSQRPPSRRHGTPGILRPVAEPTLVRMTGGGYFFLPSLPATRFLWEQR